MCELLTYRTKGAEFCIQIKGVFIMGGVLANAKPLTMPSIPGVLNRFSRQTALHTLANALPLYVKVSHMSGCWNLLHRSSDSVLKCPKVLGFVSPFDVSNKLWSTCNAVGT